MLLKGVTLTIAPMIHRLQKRELTSDGPLRGAGVALSIIRAKRRIAHGTQPDLRGKAPSLQVPGSQAGKP